MREARVEDAWEVADTHCSAFYPNYSFPVDLLLRLNRFIGMVSGLSAPPGCMMSCLVAVRCHELRLGGLDTVFGFNRGYVAGVLTIDTNAEFLPRKGPSKHRRYIQNLLTFSVYNVYCFIIFERITQGKRLFHNYVIVFLTNSYDLQLLILPNLLSMVNIGVISVCEIKLFKNADVLCMK